MALSILEIINIAKVSQYLAAADKSKGALFGPIKIPISPVILYCERKAVEWLYDIDPTDDTLRLTADYLYSLCRGYNLQAQNIINGGSGGGVSPISPSVQFPIYITQSDFETATFYPNPSIAGNSIIIFLNEINRYLIPNSEFTVSASGINITFDGFDALTNTYNLIIEKVTIN